MVQAQGIRAVVVVAAKVAVREEAWVAGDQALVRPASVYALAAGQGFRIRQVFPVARFPARSAAGRCSDIRSNGAFDCQRERRYR